MQEEDVNLNPDLKEKTKEIEKNFHTNLAIGILNETNFEESRVSLTPDDAEILINNGNEVYVEFGAGDKIGYSDEDYYNAGCRITTREEIYKKKLIIKITPLVIEDVEKMDSHQIIVSFLSISFQDKKLFELLLEKDITSIFTNLIKDEYDEFILENSLGQIEGSASIFVASEIMSNKNIGSGYMLGGITGVMPTNIVVIGANTTGQYASRLALSLGASVKVFDNSLSRLNKLNYNVGFNVSTSVINQKLLYDAIRSCDVLIYAMKGEIFSPLIVTEDMVMKMKKKSLIIDLAICHGGGVETSNIGTFKSPYFIKNDVIHYSVPNISSKFPKTASTLLSSLFLNRILMIQRSGLPKIINNDKGFVNGIVTYKGLFVNEKLAKYFNFNYTNLDYFLLQ